jgi:hypothetical protein
LLLAGDGLEEVATDCRRADPRPDAGETLPGNADEERRVAQSATIHA